ncbi:hypothetical protein Pla100_04070 [Neorhodopirellula pilleata]|uniref:Uncharacterized protein n=2 Tax=Neorhodopirellula pilleata TaxID=2714738 RepID=A0A5C6AUS1_9BACT|nr:hypothetical protein Pla100_04070 [Neorhodopirellula pilleata]
MNREGKARESCHGLTLITVGGGFDGDDRKVWTKPCSVDLLNIIIARIVFPEKFDSVETFASLATVDYF